MAADSASALELGDAFWQLASALGLGEQEYGGSGPRAKLQMALWGVDSVVKTTQFTEAGAKLYPPRYCDVRLRSRPSGLLIDAAQRRHSPPTDEAAFAWPSFVSPVRTSVICVANRGEARSFLGVDAWRRARAAATVSYVLSATVFPELATSAAARGPRCLSIRFYKW